VAGLQAVLWRGMEMNESGRPYLTPVQLIVPFAVLWLMAWEGGMVSLPAGGQGEPINAFLMILMTMQQQDATDCCKVITID